MPDSSRVVITGIGLALPVGLRVDEVWARCRRSESAIRELRRFDTGDHCCRASAEAPPFELSGRLRSPKNQKFMSRSVACGTWAAHQAMVMSGIDLSSGDAYRRALYVGSGQTGLEASEFFESMAVAGESSPHYRELGGRASRLLDRYWSLRTLANAGVGLLASEFDVRGPSDNFVQGDTASAMAVAAGHLDLLEDRCDVALVGGYDSLLSESTYLAYESEGLLSPSAPDVAGRPFDRDRDGIVLGEGGTFLVLEREPDARRRGATIWGTLLGVGLSQEADDRERPKQSASALQHAMDEAGDGEPVEFVIAHGIGTPEGDRDEAALIAKLSPARPPVTAFKGLTGYLGAATAITELALGVIATRHRSIPPIARHAASDPDCELRLVAGAGRPMESVRPSFLSLSWSWTGQCAAMAARAS